MIEWINEFKVMEVKLVQLFLFGVFLIMIAFLIRMTMRLVLPLNMRVPWLKREFPFIQFTLIITIIIVGIYSIFNDQPVLIIILISILFTILIWASRFAIKDFVCGIILKTEEPYQVNDHIRINDIEGRVSKAGLRSLQITTSDNQLIRIPYSRISETLFAKTTMMDGFYTHTFRLELPKSAPLPAVIENLRMTILNCIWSSVVNEPSICYDSEGSAHYVLEITVYAISTDYFSRIEDKVRRSVVDSNPQNAEPTA